MNKDQDFNASWADKLSWVRDRVIPQMRMHLLPFTKIGCMIITDEEQGGKIVLDKIVSARLFDYVPVINFGMQREEDTIRQIRGHTLGLVVIDRRIVYPYHVQDFVSKRVLLSLSNCLTVASAWADKQDYPFSRHDFVCDMMAHAYKTDGHPFNNLIHKE